MIDQSTLIRAAYRLEPLPDSAQRILAITGKEDWDLKLLEEVVSLDQALTVRLLALANSVQSASRQPIGTVREAVVRLGTGSLISIALATGVQRTMLKALPEYGLSEGELWRHAMASALAAESIPAITKRRLPPEGFTAALLHDIGKLIVARFLDPEVLRLLREAREKGGESSREAEEEVLGLHHGELGGLIARHWKLPEGIVVGIVHHHTPEEARDPIADVAHVANIVAKRAGAGTHFVPQDLELDPDALARLGLAPADVETLREKVAERLEEVLGCYSAPAPPSLSPGASASGSGRKLVRTRPAR